MSSIPFPTTISVILRVPQERGVVPSKSVPVNFEKYPNTQDVLPLNSQFIFQSSDAEVLNTRPAGHMHRLKPICTTQHPTFKFSLRFLMLTVQKYHYNCRWNSWFSIFRFWSPSFLIVTSLISLRTTCFHRNDSPTLSSSLSKSFYFDVVGICL